MAARKRISLDQSTIGGFIFYSILCLPIVGGLAVILLFYFSPDEIKYSAKLVSVVVGISPFIAKDLSLLGEVTPAIFAGSVIALSPASGKLKSWEQLPNLIAIVLTIVIYIQYVHLSLFFSPGGDGVAILDINGYSDERRKLILNMINNVRITSTVIFASIIGLRIKDTGEAR